VNFSPSKEKTSTAVIAPAKRRHRLFRKYVAFFVFVVCLALLSNDVIELRFLVRDYTAFAVRLQHEQAQTAANKIEEFIKDIEDQIRWTTHLSWPIATLEEWQLDASRLLYQVPAITEYIKVDAGGIERLRVSRFAPDSIGSGMALSQDTRVTSALANMVYYGPVSFRRESEPYMTISMSGPGKDVSIAEINLKFVWDIVSQIRIGQRGKAYVVDDNGRLIAHPDLNLVLRNTNVSQLRQVRSASLAERAIRLGEREIVEDLDGRQVLDASAPITSLKWRLFVERPRDEALAPIEALLQRSVLVLIAALIIATFAGLLLAHKMVVPIQSLQAGAARIGNRKFDQRIVIKTGDELEALAEQFNLMAADVEEAHANLQMKVELRTAELSAANTRLAAAAERLRQTNVFKNEILGMVAHDLKNPMSVIMGRAELLAEMIEKTSSPREKLVAQVRSISNAGKQLTEMVDSLLADAMADAHEISIRRTAIHIPTLIDEVAETHRPLADKKGQVFTVKTSTNMTVIGDHDRLREAIDNLVSNAIKYTPLAGHIDLAVISQGGRALIRVVDDGPGLTAADLTRLFGRFQRLSAKPTGGERSTGLGLSIVKRIVELHGGSVLAESAGPGRGTIFTISLPLTEGEITNVFDTDRLSGVRSVVTGSRNPFRGTILLIEDEAVVREALEDLLRLEGIGVVSATNGDEALVLVSAKGVRPDLIISDYNLPGRMNGVENIEALRMALAWETPGIVLTGDARPFVLKAISRYNIGVAPKPFEIDELLRLIASLYFRSKPAIR
jgi:two-component system, NtrC family, sensor kinase